MSACRLVPVPHVGLLPRWKCLACGRVCDVAPAAPPDWPDHLPPCGQDFLDRPPATPVQAAPPATAAIAAALRREWFARAVETARRGRPHERTPDQVAALLDRITARDVWPACGCGLALAAWVADVLNPDRWREEWGEAIS